MVKALEDVVVKYDGTVRDGYNNIVQFLYGEDGMDGACVETQMFDFIKDSESVFKKRFGYTDKELKTFSKKERSLLNQEFIDLKEGAEALRHINQSREPASAKISDCWIPLPVNVRRITWNVQKTIESGGPVLSEIEILLLWFLARLKK